MALRNILLRSSSGHCESDATLSFLLLSSLPSVSLPNQEEVRSMSARRLSSRLLSETYNIRLLWIPKRVCKPAHLFDRLCTLEWSWNKQTSFHSRDFVESSDVYFTVYSTCIRNHRKLTCLLLRSVRPAGWSNIFSFCGWGVNFLTSTHRVLPT